tara:strand:- start:158 stop:523 length:366 start_codon:yes stop_codon:yes gene_type:complete
MINLKEKGVNRYLFIIALALLFFFGGGALSIVWLRMEISSVARNCGQLEGEMEIVGREVAQLRGQRAKSLRPSSLAVMVEGRLLMPPAKNTYHISNLDMANRLRESGNRGYRIRGEFAGTR